MTFSCHIESQSSSGTSSNRACTAKPTLLTRTSSAWELVNRPLDHRVRSVRLGEVGDDVQRLADPRRGAPPAGDDARTLRDEQASGLESDSGGRPGNDAHLPSRPRSIGD